MALIFKPPQHAAPYLDMALIIGGFRHIIYICVLSKGFPPVSFNCHMYNVTVQPLGLCKLQPVPY
jgi:hypothetical protein